MTPVTARDAQTPVPDERAGAGVSQKPGGMLWGIPLRGDSGRPGRRGIHFEAMNPGISLENSKNKGRRPGTPLCLTPAARGHNISVDRGT
jgi:hypothetical protein